MSFEMREVIWLFFAAFSLILNFWCYSNYEDGDFVNKEIFVFLSGGEVCLMLSTIRGIQGVL